MAKSLVVRVLALSVVASVALVSTACGGSDPVPQQSTTEQTQAPRARSIVLYQYRFNPNTLTIPAGTTVTFNNKDPERHNVNIPALNVDQNIDPNGSWSYTFDTRGEFAVTSRFNNSMNLTLIVE